MDIQSLLGGIAERVSAGATVNNVYGGAISAGDRTVVPAAEIRYAFGGGGGGAKGETSAQNGGGGGRASARPVGALEITPQGTRFLHFDSRKKTGAALALGFVLGAAFVSLSGTKRIEVTRRVAQ